MKTLQSRYVAAVPVLYSGPFGMSLQYPLEKAGQRCSPSNIYSCRLEAFEREGGGVFNGYSFMNRDLLFSGFVTVLCVQ